MDTDFFSSDEWYGMTKDARQGYFDAFVEDQKSKYGEEAAKGLLSAKDDVLSEADKKQQEFRGSLESDVYNVLRKMRADSTLSPLALREPIDGGTPDTKDFIAQYAKTGADVLGNIWDIATASAADIPISEVLYTNDDAFRRSSILSGKYLPDKLKPIFERAGITDPDEIKNRLNDAVRTFEWSGVDDGEVRNLFDGSLALNPAVVANRDAAVGIQAISQSSATPEAKEEAMQRFNTIRKGMATRLDEDLVKYDISSDGESYSEYRKKAVASGVTDPEKLVYGWKGMDKDGIDQIFDFVKDVSQQVGRDLANRYRGVVAAGATLVGAEGAVAELGKTISQSSEKSAFINQLRASRGEAGGLQQNAFELAVSGGSLLDFIAVGKVAKLVGGGAQAGARATLANATRGLGVGAAAYIQGSGSIYEQAFAKLTEEAKAEGRTLTDEDYFNAAKEVEGAAALNGLQTAATSFMFRGGKESAAFGVKAGERVSLGQVLRSARAEFGENGLRAALRKAAPEMVKAAKELGIAAKHGFKDEAVEEAVNQLTESIITRSAGLDEDTPWGEVFVGAAKAGLFGGLLGAGTEATVSAFTDYSKLGDAGLKAVADEELASEAQKSLQEQLLGEDTAPQQPELFADTEQLKSTKPETQPPAPEGAPEDVAAQTEQSTQLDLFGDEQVTQKTDGGVSGNLLQAAGEAGAIVSKPESDELAELDDLMLRRGQFQNKVKGVKFSKKDEARFQELGNKHRDKFFERLQPKTDPVVWADINGELIRVSNKGTFYTMRDGRPRTGVSFQPPERIARNFSPQAVSASVVDAHNVELPDGYVRQGDKYVYAPTKESPVQKIVTFAESTGRKVTQDEAVKIEEAVRSGDIKPLVAEKNKTKLVNIAREYRDAQQSAAIDDTLSRVSNDAEKAIGRKVGLKRVDSEGKISKKISAVAEKLGLKLVTFEQEDGGDDIEGFVDPNDRSTVFINSKLKAADVAKRVFVHEVVHAMRGSMGKEFSKFVEKAKTEGYKQKWDELTSKHGKTAVRDEEFAARVVEGNLTVEQLEKLAASDEKPSTIRKILEAIVEAFKIFREKSGVDYNPEVRKAAERLLKEAIRKSREEKKESTLDTEKSKASQFIDDTLTEPSDRFKKAVYSRGIKNAKTVAEVKQVVDDATLGYIPKQADKGKRYFYSLKESGPRITKEQVQETRDEVEKEAKKAGVLFSTRITPSINSPIERTDRTTNAQDGFKILKKAFGETTAKLLRANVGGSIDNASEFTRWANKTFPVKNHLKAVVEKASGFITAQFSLHLLSIGGPSELPVKDETRGIKDVAAEKDYDLTEIEDYDHLLSFKFDYEGGNGICSHGDPTRIDRNFIFHLRKNNASETPRATELTQENLTPEWKEYLKADGRLKPDGTYDLNDVPRRRQDPYGVSVLNIQINRSNGYLKIINRYNHALDTGPTDADGAFNYDLDKIADGLFSAMSKHAKVLAESVNAPQVSKSTGEELPYLNDVDYVVRGRGGTFLLASEESGGVIFGEGFVIKDGVTHLANPSNQVSASGRIFTNGEVIGDEGLLFFGDHLKGSKIHVSGDTVSGKRPDGTVWRGVVEKGHFVEFEDSTNAVGASSLTGLRRLKSLKLPSVTSIGWGSVHSIDSLESLDLSSVTSIGGASVHSMISLESLDLSSVTSIGRGSVHSMDSLESIKIKDSVELRGEKVSSDEALELLGLPSDVRVETPDTLFSTKQVQETGIPRESNIAEHVKVGEAAKAIVAFVDNFTSREVSDVINDPAKMTAFTDSAKKLFEALIDAYPALEAIPEDGFVTYTVQYLAKRALRDNATDPFHPDVEQARAMMNKYHAGAAAASHVLNLGRNLSDEDTVSAAAEVLAAAGDKVTQDFLDALKEKGFKGDEDPKDALRKAAVAKKEAETSDDAALEKDAAQVEKDEVEFDAESQQLLDVAAAVYDQVSSYLSSKIGDWVSDFAETEFRFSAKNAKDKAQILKGLLFGRNVPSDVRARALEEFKRVMTELENESTSPIRKKKLGAAGKKITNAVDKKARTKISVLVKTVNAVVEGTATADMPHYAKLNSAYANAQNGVDAKTIAAALAESGEISQGQSERIAEYLIAQSAAEASRVALEDFQAVVKSTNDRLTRELANNNLKQKTELSKLLSSLYTKSEKELTDNKKKIINKIKAADGSTHSNAQYAAVFDNLVNIAKARKKRLGPKLAQSYIDKIAEKLTDPTPVMFTRANFKNANTVADVEKVISDALFGHLGGKIPPDMARTAHDFAVQIIDAKKAVEARRTLRAELARVVRENGKPMTVAELKVVALEIANDLNSGFDVARAITDKEVNDVVENPPLPRVGTLVTKDVIAKMVTDSTAFNDAKDRRKNYTSILMGTYGFTAAQAESYLNAKRGTSGETNFEKIEKMVDRRRKAISERQINALLDFADGAKDKTLKTTIEGAVALIRENGVDGAAAVLNSATGSKGAYAITSQDLVILQRAYAILQEGQSNAMVIWAERVISEIEEKIKSTVDPGHFITATFYTNLFSTLKNYNLQVGAGLVATLQNAIHLGVTNAARFATGKGYAGLGVWVPAIGAGVRNALIHMGTQHSLTGQFTLETIQGANFQKTALDPFTRSRLAAASGMDSKGLKLLASNVLFGFFTLKNRLIGVWDAGFSALNQEVVRRNGVWAAQAKGVKRSELKKAINFYLDPNGGFRKSVTDGILNGNIGLLNDLILQAEKDKIYDLDPVRGAQWFEQAHTKIVQWRNDALISAHIDHIAWGLMVSDLTRRGMIEPEVAQDWADSADRIKDEMFGYSSFVPNATPAEIVSTAIKHASSSFNRGIRSFAILPDKEGKMKPPVLRFLGYGAEAVLNVTNITFVGPTNLISRMLSSAMIATFMPVALLQRMAVRALINAHASGGAEAEFIRQRYYATTGNEATLRDWVIPASKAWAKGMLGKQTVHIGDGFEKFRTFEQRMNGLSDAFKRGEDLVKNFTVDYAIASVALQRSLGSKQQVMANSILSGTLHLAITLPLIFKIFDDDDDDDGVYYDEQGYPRVYISTGISYPEWRKKGIIANAVNVRGSDGQYRPVAVADNMFFVFRPNLSLVAHIQQQRIASRQNERKAEYAKVGKKLETSINWEQRASVSSTLVDATIEATPVLANVLDTATKGRDSSDLVSKTFTRMKDLTTKFVPVFGDSSLQALISATTGRSGSSGQVEAGNAAFNKNSVRGNFMALSDRIEFAFTGEGEPVAVNSIGEPIPYGALRFIFQDVLAADPNSLDRVYGAKTTQERVMALGELLGTFGNMNGYNTPLSSQNQPLLLMSRQLGVNVKNSNTDAEKALSAGKTNWADMDKKVKASMRRQFRDIKFNYVNDIAKSYNYDMSEDDFRATVKEADSVAKAYLGID